MGIKDITTGGYHSRPFRAAKVERLGIPGFHFSDGPRGVVVGEATAFPVSMARGATFDPELEVRVGDAIGKELRTIGADLYGGICVNLLRHPAWGRAQETYGEDPHHVGEMGAALTRGAQRHVMATLKHFALNSMENARFGVDVTVDERALHEVYLPHFKRIVDEGVACVMTAYNSVNGQWCSQNEELLAEILRDEWGFAGFVISDWIFGVRDGVKSLQAGLDVEMPYRMIRNAPIVAALAEGLITEELVDSAVTRTIATMLKFNIGELPERDRSVVLCKEHLMLSQEVAEKSMVLLKNESVGGTALLPLDLKHGSKIAMFGRLAAARNIGDGGSSDVMAPNVVTPFIGIREHFANCEVAHDPQANLATQVQQARQSDLAIVVVGYTKEEEGEFIGEDVDGDGKADKFTIFADKLNIPTSIVFANGGLVVSMAPYFLFLKDTDGDDRADVREIIMKGWDKNDTHFGPSNLQYGFNNKIWGVVGSGFTGLSKDGKEYNFRTGVYNLNPDGTGLNFLGNTSNNTWGLGITEENNVFISTANNTHSAYYSMPASLLQRNLLGSKIQSVQKIDGHYDSDSLTPNLRQVDVVGGFTSAAGHHFYTARDFPKSYWNRIAFVCEPTVRLIHNAIISPNGSGFSENDGWNLLASSDEWVGPVQAEVGPDGAVWVADWYNFIIQHNVFGIYWNEFFWLESHIDTRSRSLVKS